MMATSNNDDDDYTQLGHKGNSDDDAPDSDNNVEMREQSHAFQLMTR